jgi:DNA invertase Pin-like site-specific DNA recombinase
MLRSGDELMVFKLDRLARSTRQLIQTVDELEQRGIKLRSLTEQIDTQSPTGRFFLHVISCVSEFERQNLRERVRAGIESARAHGRIGGRPRAMSDDDVRAAKAMLKDGSIPVGEVARRLGVGVSTLYRSVPGGRSAA